MLDAQMVRVAHRDGNTVTWQNMVGGFLGQGATFEFGTEQQAIEFETYATQADVPGGPPSLHPDVLAARGWEVVRKES